MFLTSENVHLKLKMGCKNLQGCNFFDLIIFNETKIKRKMYYYIEI